MARKAVLLAPPRCALICNTRPVAASKKGQLSDNEAAAVGKQGQESRQGGSEVNNKYEAKASKRFDTIILPAL